MAKPERPVCVLVMRLPTAGLPVAKSTSVIARAVTGGGGVPNGMRVFSNALPSLVPMATAVLIWSATILAWV